MSLVESIDSSAEHDVEFYWPNCSISCLEIQKYHAGHYVLHSPTRIKITEEIKDRTNGKSNTASPTKLFENIARGGRNSK